MKVDEISKYVLKNALEHYIQRLTTLKDIEGLKNIPQSVTIGIEAEKTSADGALNSVNMAQQEYEINGEQIVKHGKVMCNALTTYQGDLQNLMEQISKELHGARPRYELVYSEIEKIPSLIKTLCPK